MNCARIIVILGLTLSGVAMTTFWENSTATTPYVKKGYVKAVAYGPLPHRLNTYIFESQTLTKCLGS